VIQILRRKIMLTKTQMVYLWFGIKSSIWRNIFQPRNTTRMTIRMRMIRMTVRGVVRFP
jgi:hypothetical protein